MAEVLALGGLLVLGGVGLLVVAALAQRGRLGRNRWVGVRTPATMASDAAWEAGHRAAAGPLAACGAVHVAGGVALLAWPAQPAVLLGTLGATLALTAGLVAMAAVAAGRAARATGARGAGSPR